MRPGTDAALVLFTVAMAALMLVVGWRTPEMRRCRTELAAVCAGGNGLFLRTSDGWVWVPVREFRY